jgi:hypothetical protein
MSVSGLSAGLINGVESLTQIPLIQYSPTAQSSAASVQASGAAHCLVDGKQRVIPTHPSQSVSLPHSVHGMTHRFSLGKQYVFWAALHPEVAPEQSAWVSHSQLCLQWSNSLQYAKGSFIAALQNLLLFRQLSVVWVGV